MCSNIIDVATLCNPVKYMMCGNAEFPSIINIFHSAAIDVHLAVRELWRVQLHVMQGATRNHNKCDLESASCDNLVKNLVIALWLAEYPAEFDFLAGAKARTEAHQN